jgi:tyrosine-specific transport protein
MKSTYAIAALSLSYSAYAFQNGGILQRSNAGFSQSGNSASARNMKSAALLESDEGSRSRMGRRFEPVSQQVPYSKTSLSVATLEDAEALPDRLSLPNISPGNMDSVTKVLSASLLITGNTVGSSMFVLPDAVGEVGLAMGSAIFFGLYIFNLISGLLLADVAINLHESSECEVPSSFKDFVDSALQSEVAGTAMAGASLLSNSCFLAFGIVHAGHLAADTLPGLGLDPIVGAGAFSAMIAAFSLTQTNKGLESIANAAVIVLFSSFATLLLPSLAHVSDPMGTILAPGNSPDGLATAAALAIPLLLSSLAYQNIVPSITKLLDFDRTKSTIAVAVGSFIPMAMYIAWCYAVLGGGLDSSTSSDAGAAAFTAFSASALVGSCVASVMSLAEEYESIMSSVTQDNDVDSCPVESKFSLPAVALSMALPVAVGLAYSEGGDLTGALHFNGAFITPVLYGLLPIILYQSVQKKESDDNAGFGLPEILLGAGTVGALGQEIMHDVVNLLA